MSEPDEGFASPETVLRHPKPSTATPSWTSISISTGPGPWTRSPSSPTLCLPSSSPPPTSPALRSGPSPTMPTTSLPPSASAAVFVYRNVLGFSHVSFGNPDLIPESRTENDEKRRLPPSVSH
ncbi:hypothetical protein CK203_024261 [Vitis vinifera]|uniref:Uncharacterized protein n=1 Tax=Vitis vinifera TaxID=29760 RepID=A0A438I4G9_VITVI|nr:hypothetical protein CK203_024261 [Vitis vinifera]